MFHFFYLILSLFSKSQSKYMRDQFSQVQMHSLIFLIAHAMRKVASWKWTIIIYTIVRSKFFFVSPKDEGRYIKSSIYAEKLKIFPSFTNNVCSYRKSLGISPSPSCITHPGLSTATFKIRDGTRKEWNMSIWFN